MKTALWKRGDIIDFVEFADHERRLAVIAARPSTLSRLCRGAHAAADRELPFGIARKCHAVDIAISLDRNENERIGIAADASAVVLRGRTRQTRLFAVCVVLDDLDVRRPHFEPLEDNGREIAVEHRHVVDDQLLPSSPQFRNCLLLNDVRAARKRRDRGCEKVENAQAP